MVFVARTGLLPCRQQRLHHGGSWSLLRKFCAVNSRIDFTELARAPKPKMSDDGSERGEGSFLLNSCFLRIPLVTNASNM